MDIIVFPTISHTKHKAELLASTISSSQVLVYQVLGESNKLNYKYWIIFLAQVQVFFQPESQVQVEYMFVQVECK